MVTSALIFSKMVPEAGSGSCRGREDYLNRLGIQRSGKCPRSIVASGASSSNTYQKAEEQHETGSNAEFRHAGPSSPSFRNSANEHLQTSKSESPHEVTRSVDVKGNDGFR